MLSWFLTFAQRRNLALSVFTRAKKQLQKLIEDMYVHVQKLDEKKDKIRAKVDALNHDAYMLLKMQTHLNEEAEDIRQQIQKIDTFVGS
jgi:SMC interacting uncharacterized protein involved in chromosome segregation